MWIKLGRKDYYLFEKRPEKPIDLTALEFRKYTDQLAANEMKARKEEIAVSRREVEAAKFKLQHEANMDKIKNLTPEEAADILSKMDAKGLPTTPIKKTEWGDGFSPKSIQSWLGSQGTCWCGVGACSTSCITTPCDACRPKDFWRVTDEN